jgi:hypothetical protein
VIFHSYISLPEGIDCYRALYANHNLYIVGTQPFQWTPFPVFQVRPRLPIAIVHFPNHFIQNVRPERFGNDWNTPCPKETAQAWNTGFIQRVLWTYTHMCIYIYVYVYYIHIWINIYIYVYTYWDIAKFVWCMYNQLHISWG